MTRHNQLQLGGMPVLELLEREHDALVRRVLDDLVQHVPLYDRLPRELIDGDVRAVADHALRLFPASLAGGPPDEELSRITESAALRADEGVPMEMVLAAYHHGARVAVDHCFQQARPEEIADARILAVGLFDYMEKLSKAVVAGFTGHGKTVLAEQADARQRLLAALLAGEGFHEAAGPAEVALGEAWLVVRLSVGVHPDEADPLIAPEVAARRKLRRLRTEIDRHYAAPVLWQPSLDGGLLLVPQPDLDRLRRVLGAARRLAGAPLWAAATPAAPEEIAAAAPLSGEIIDVVLATGRPEGVYELADVALDYQLRQTSPAQPVLAALLATLDEHPELLCTLDVHQRTGMNRRRAATELQVHPNTIDNRLRRIARLTGLDPTKPDHLPTIQAALMARAALRERPGRR